MKKTFYYTLTIVFLCLFFIYLLYSQLQIKTMSGNSANSLLITGNVNMQFIQIIFYTDEGIIKLVNFIPSLIAVVLLAIVLVIPKKKEKILLGSFLVAYSIYNFVFISDIVMSINKLLSTTTNLSITRELVSFSILGNNTIEKNISLIPYYGLSFFAIIVSCYYIFKGSSREKNITNT